MSEKVRPVPEGFSTLTPHLVVRGASEAIVFYAKAFGAVEVTRTEMAGTILHAQLRIGDSMLMIADEFPDWGALGPQEGRRSPVVIHVYTDDVDALFERAVAAGAEVSMPLDDTFWGDRYGTLTDPFGHAWSLATRKEDVSPDDLAERARQAFGGGEGTGA